MKKEIGKIPVFRMAFKIYIGLALAKGLIKGLSNVLNMYSEMIFRYLEKRRCDGSDFGNMVYEAFKLAGYEQQQEDEKIKNKYKMGFEFK